MWHKLQVLGLPRCLCILLCPLRCPYCAQQASLAPGDAGPLEGGNRMAQSLSKHYRAEAGAAECTASEGSPTKLGGTGGSGASSPLGGRLCVSGQCSPLPAPFSEGPRVKSQGTWDLTRELRHSMRQKGPPLCRQYGPCWSHLLPQIQCADPDLSALEYSLIWK